MIAFSIPITPVPKGRPRFFRGHAVTPKETRQFEREFALRAAKFGPAEPLEGALAVSLVFQLPKPRSVKRDYPSVRPDLDNFVKAVMDSMGAFWLDDGQVVSLRADKRYGDVPLIIVQLKGVKDSRAPTLTEEEEHA